MFALNKYLKHFWYQEARNPQKLKVEACISDFMGKIESESILYLNLEIIEGGPQTWDGPETMVSCQLVEELGGGQVGVHQRVIMVDMNKNTPAGIILKALEEFRSEITEVE